VADLIAGASYIDTPVDIGRAALSRRLRRRPGRKWKDAHAIRFHDDGAVNFPYLSERHVVPDTAAAAAGVPAQARNRINAAVAAAGQSHRLVTRRLRAQVGVGFAAGNLMRAFSDADRSARLWDGNHRRHYAPAFEAEDGPEARLLSKSTRDSHHLSPNWASLRGSCRGIRCRRGSRACAVMPRIQLIQGGCAPKGATCI